MQDVFPVLAIGAALFGAILGSFLNALLFRFNTGRTMGGRSQCMRCGHTLGILDLFPVISYLLIGGRCRYCGVKISWQYPLVEVLALVLSLKLFFMYSDNLLLYVLWLGIWLTILFIVVYDLRHMVIPWSSSILLLVLSLAQVFVTGGGVWAYAAGPLLALPFVVLSGVSRGRWMGWGDSGFELSLGLLLGVAYGATALMLSVWSGAAVGLLIIAWQRVSLLTPTRGSRSQGQGFTIKSEIPFAPFLALGAAIVFFFHVDFFSTLSLF